MNYLSYGTHMNMTRAVLKMKLIPKGAWLAATVWLALAAVWPARADTAPGDAKKERTYTLAEETIRHARENLPKQVSTENPELTKQVHDLYRDCTFDKLWEPALPGLPYRFFSISGAGDKSYAKFQCDGETIKSVNPAGERSEISFTALPGKTYRVSESEASSVSRLTVKGGRFLSLNTVIRVNQIEAARNLNEGTDEAAVHTPETVAAFRDAVSKGFPGAKVTWAFSWLALHDERPNYAAIRKQVAGYHKTYGDGSISYPFYPSREHGCKPAQGKADFIDCVNLDGWTCDFLCARRFGFDGGFNSRLGVGPIESYRNLGLEKGMAEVMAVTANHFDDGFTRNGFGWVTNCWEISLVKNLKPEVLPCLTQWLQNIRQRWPDAKVVTQGEFGEAWRRENPDNKNLNYQFVQRGTGIGGSEPNLEIRWFNSPDFRLAILRDWQKDEPAKLIDFTRYDLPAREPADPTADKPSRNWSLINRINQKHRRPEDAPVPLKNLTQEEQALIRKHYPDLF